MSITSSIPDDQGFAFSAAGLPCFYCRETLIDPAVYWMGASGDLYLHPSCVFPLFVRLCRDVHELDCPDYYARIEKGLRRLRP